MQKAYTKSQFHDTTSVRLYGSYASPCLLHPKVQIKTSSKQRSNFLIFPLTYYFLLHKWSIIAMK